MLDAQVDLVSLEEHLSVILLQSKSLLYELMNMRSGFVRCHLGPYRSYTVRPPTKFYRFHSLLVAYFTGKRAQRWV
jgi:hypothetical protein